MNFQDQVLSGWGNIPHSNCKEGFARNEDDITSSLEFSNIIPRGLGRSYADQATNAERYVVNNIWYNHFLNFDEEKGILECESGVSLDDIIRVFGPRGWFPMITPGTKFVTIGGCIANDVHGKAHHVDGTFVNCVIDMKIMLANGEIVNASRQENPDLFWATFGGLGLLGFILSARIRLRKIQTTYFKQKSIAIRDLGHLLDQFELSNDQYNYSVAWVDSLATGKKLGKGVLNLGNMATIDDLPEGLRKVPLLVSGKPKLNVPFYLPGFTLNSASVAILNKVLDIKQRGGTGISHYDNFFYPLDMINNWNRGYGEKGFIQYQFVVPMDNGRQNIERIMKKIASSGCVPFLNVLKKFGKKSRLLSFPMEGYTFAIDFPINRRLRSFTKELDQMVYDSGGRIYLGKDGMLDEAMFKKMYPEHEPWLEIKKKYDPANIFQSDLSRRLGLMV